MGKIGLFLTQFLLWALVAWFLTGVVPAKELCPSLDDSKPGHRDRVIKKGDVPGLLKALRTAAPGTTLWLQDGVYRLAPNQSLEVKTRAITIRGLSGRRGSVRIEGGYNNVSVDADDFTLADVTVDQPRYHNVQIRGEQGVLRAKIYNVHLVDAGQQFVKVSTGDGTRGKFADEGTIACSLFEYSTHAPSSYTNGVDILAGNAWLIRDNIFRRIRSKTGVAGPAILVWKNARGTVVKRNIIIDSWRGIALGVSRPNQLSRGGVSVKYDHRDGLVENNVFLALNEPADAAIENSYAANSRVFHNTIYYNPAIDHAVQWSIEYRFPPTTAVIKNNLTNRPILKRSPLPLRDAEKAGNITDARRGWFRNIEAGEFHLKKSGRSAIDAGAFLPETSVDIDGTPRPLGKAPDVGADEFDLRDSGNR